LALRRHKGKGSIKGYSDAKERLDEIMKPAKPWRVHDLRRTAASGMASLGFQPHIIERVLNHVSGAQGGLVGVYQRYEYIDDRKRALFAWGNHVETLVSDNKPAANVILLRA
jgi:integrase